MARVVYSMSTFQEVEVERAGGGQNQTETHLYRYTVTNVHPTASIRGWVEVNNGVIRDSGSIPPGGVWVTEFSPALALGGASNRVGIGVGEAYALPKEPEPTTEV